MSRVAFDRSKCLAFFFFFSLSFSNILLIYVIPTVLEANPWRESSKPVYVLTHRENQLCTMKTRRNRRSALFTFGVLFSIGYILLCPLPAKVLIFKQRS